MSLTKKFSVVIPARPNFITVGEQKLSIADFSESVLRAIGREWTTELVKEGKKKRATRPTGLAGTGARSAPAQGSLHDAAHDVSATTPAPEMDV